MNLLQRLLKNHVLANATFVVVLLVGTLTYFKMPRAQDPEINFNWISIVTRLPGASAEDVEKLITDPLEEAIQKVPDIKLVSSTSRESLSNILVRFNDISDREFDKRVTDLRREVQSQTNSELPSAADDPHILEITTANSFPTATVVVTGNADDEVLRRVALNIKKDIERIKGVDDVNTAALVEPELLVEFFPDRLQANRISPTQLADTIQSFFKDTAAGDLHIGNQQWLVRLIGTNSDPGYIARLPIVGTQGEVPVDAVARVRSGREDATEAVSYNGQPSVMFGVTKQAYVNTLELVDKINEYIESKNKIVGQYGIEVVLLDDQSVPAKKAIGVMQSNALLGLMLVILATWLFLGLHISMFIGLGIPFTLAGTFWVLDIANQTINQSVLLGVVIVLGMLIDDAVVVVEAIYYRIQRGAQSLQASIDSLKEVFSPVTSSVLTTVAAFSWLMFLPGIFGDFMFVVPFVVIVALLLSLLEAFWVLPVHVGMIRLNLKGSGTVQERRVKFLHWVRVKYTQLVVKVLRHPWLSIAGVFSLLVLAIVLYFAGAVKVQFFAFDPLRLFYINIEMPAGTPLHKTLQQVETVEAKTRKYFEEGELRGVVSVSGQMFTEMAPFFGDQFGQITVSLNPRDSDMRGVSEIIEEMREEVESTIGPKKVSFLIMEGGPPKGRPINVKVRGDEFGQINDAVTAIKSIISGIPGVKNLSDDASPGKLELNLQFDTEALRNAQLVPSDIARNIRLMFDGEIVASMQHQGEELEVRVRAMPETIQDIESVLARTIALPDGGSIAIGQLVNVSTGEGRGNIRHYNFRRTVTVEADLDKGITDTAVANNIILEEWSKININHPTIDLEFTGELDDIEESMDAMIVMLFLGLGLIYLILGAQFSSYFQPFMIIFTIPLAFAGVTFGLAMTQNPFSLYTMYGIVALTGISVNAAIVMIHAANQRLSQGMTVLHATIYAARRRVIPIIITSLTTIAGLFSLAVGLGGKSLLWGPVASAIVWGLMFSTVLTLFVIPLLYQAFMRRSRKVIVNH